METIIFKDRREGGRQLAKALAKRGYKGQNTLVFGIPRGGLVVAEEVAQPLSAALDVIIARKLRAPYQPELGMGAVVNGGHVTVNENLLRAVGATQGYLDREIAYQKEEIERRLRFYRGEHPAPEVSGKTVIVVDDGIATGYTFRAALESLRQRNPDRLVAAAPVAALDSAEMLKAFADEVVCLQTPVSFFAVGAWYQNFDQVSDEEAAAILHRNWSRWSWVTLFRAGRQSMNPKKPKEVVIPAGRVRLKAMFALPLQAKGVVAFAHGSGSGRLSPRNNFVAQALQEAGIATLLADLLEEEEALDRRNVFNITLLADRLLANAQWLRQLAETREMSIGYFGASTGAAAALQAVAREPDGVVAVVSRGGRPDLAMDYVHLVRSPTLLIVGGEDRSVIPLNELAYKKLICPKEMVVVPGATHLFEEPGALERVAELARDWFLKYFALGHEEKTS